MEEEVRGWIGLGCVGFEVIIRILNFMSGEMRSY